MLDVRVQLPNAELRRIPKTGPLIVVANHPFGGLDGLVLTTLLRRVRPDVKLLANHVLDRVPELRDAFLFVDPFDRADSAARNLAAMRSAIRWVRGGGVLGVFPAGEVSHLDLRARTVHDAQWSNDVARLVARTGAAVLPIFFEGRNSALFQIAGLVHPIARTALLPRELLNRRKCTVTARVGSTISSDRLAKFATARECADYLRVRTYILRGRTEARDHVARGVPQDQQPIADATPVDALVRNIAALPTTSRLSENGDHAVFCSPVSQIPHLLHEIGRLREITFRKVGEGTGRALDLDRFDKHYLHLFVWNRKHQEIVGAYRLGLTDEILVQHGTDGLYTSTLFRFSPGLLDELGPAIELGRSFVRPEYQREFAPLLLLWKGIGQFVARNPKYRRMFGPVSISNDYTSLTKQLLIAFLTINNNLPNLARLVKPRNPPARIGPGRRWEATLASTIASSIDEVDALVAEIEQERRGVPVLLRQYLKLGAKLLGFNVDPDFGDVLDGLMLIDLLDVDPAVLNRYLGKENVARFRALHAK